LICGSINLILKNNPSIAIAQFDISRSGLGGSLPLYSFALFCEISDQKNRFTAHYESATDSTFQIVHRAHDEHSSSSDSKLWRWPRCRIGIIPVYLSRWIGFIFMLICWFDL
jgi:hypothetical protein